ncbi:MAG TPA: hypothetical protein VMW46_00615 [Candidatus Desulfaltia sp.]|nr:hypothetical protein [Candidatus Desulfaltia sp.]
MSQSRHGALLRLYANAQRGKVRKLATLAEKPLPSHVFEPAAPMMVTL